MAEEEFQYNNEEEAEMAQLHAIHIHMNAVAEVQRAIAQQALQPSLEECEECGETIPEQRRLLSKGCTRCTHCQDVWERFHKLRGY